jgi:predicted ATPase
MLKTISVSGFKSLEKFELEFRPGLNVIVGPNGSGKTNIINFLEFLSFLSRGSLLDAVSRSGGAGNIFRRQSSHRLQRRISFTLGGAGNYKDIRKPNEEYVRYEYEAAILLANNNSSIFFEKQRIKIATGGSDDNDADKSEADWDVDIEFIYKNEPSAAIEIVWHKLNQQLVTSPFSGRKGETLNGAKARIKEALEDSAKYSVYQTLIRFVRPSRLISRDLLGAKSFNISPSVVRQSEDIASEPDIGSNGSGLAATMFMLKNSPRSMDYDYYYDDSEAQEILQKILEYSKVVNNSILSIAVEPDTIENKLRIFVTVKYKGGRLKLPFSFVSDGTAKWFALVAAILMTRSIFAIEEPENYLHPLMQRQIVEIVRRTFEFDRRNLFAVITTHSETILNCVDPEQLIVVHMDDGRTVASRPRNAQDIREEIRNSGFGAGYYYLAGAIET